jgi:hypothetical protein
MFQRFRINPGALLFLMAAIVILQELRPWLRAVAPSMGTVLGVAPNLVAGLGLPFTWIGAYRLTWSDHRSRCLVTSIALAGYEFAQGAGLVPAHRRFDPMDLVASIVGVLIASAIGWSLLRGEKIVSPSTGMANQGVEPAESTAPESCRKRR